MEEAQLLSILEGADPVPLALSLVHLTGDTSLLDSLAPHVRGPWDHQISVPEDLAESIRRRVAAELACASGGAAPRTLSRDILRRMMSTAVGEPVDERYVPLVLESMLGMPAPTSEAPDARGGLPSNRPRVLIVGAGASGLCAAIRLAQAGFDYLILEKNEDLGGTWYENRYPGCAVDLPSHFYQYSFELNEDWRHHYSRQKGVFEYLSRCADKYGVRRHVQFGCEVESAAYDERRRCWTVVARTRGGSVERFEANVLVCAVGQLNRPSIPDLPGLADFGGPAFHTAAWREDVDLHGRKVALIGTGASAVQVGPAIVDDVAALHVFQRSGVWVMRRPNIDREVSESKKWAIRNVPYYAGWYRFQLFWAFGDGLFEALRIDPDWNGGDESLSQLNAKHRASMMRYIERELEGREDLLASAIPRYPPYAKRVLADPGWYRMLRRTHVTLVDSGIDRVQRDGIRCKDGRFFPADVLVFATGFQAGRMLWPMEVCGRAGRTIRAAWGDDDPRAYLGLTVQGFPNLFVLYGPNSNFGHGGSAIFLAECQVRYMVGLLSAMAERGYVSFEVREAVHDAYNALIDAKLQSLSWSHPSARSWYRNAAGRIVTNQPWRLVEYWEMTREPVLQDYRFESGPFEGGSLRAS